MGDHLVLPSISECMHERENIAIYDKFFFSKNESIVSNHTQEVDVGSAGHAMRIIQDITDIQDIQVMKVLQLMPLTKIMFMMQVFKSYRSYKFNILF